MMLMSDAEWQERDPTFLQTLEHEGPLLATEDRGGHLHNGSDGQHVQVSILD
jgi:hypothetical protein